MVILPVDCSDPRQVREFLRLPARLYHSIPQWVPPLAQDARRALDRHHYPFYRHSEAAFFLAWDDGQAVGRLAVLNNRHYNEFNAEQTAFFHLFECAQSADAARGLFEAAFDWARGQGLNKIFGPKGFTALDGMGLLTRGFEHRPALGIPYNPAYYIDLIQRAAFEAVGEIVSGYMHRSAPIPERIHQLSEQVQRRRGLRIARFESRRDLRALVPRLGALYNATLAGTTGNVPLTEDEIQTLARQMMAFADPHLVKIVMKDDDPVGFLFAYPDISAALQRSGGRLFPLGWLDILVEFRRTHWVNINGAGIIEKYRGLGGTAILFSEMHRSVLQGRFEHAEIVQIGVENEAMQREMRSLGIDFYKAHRMYQRWL